VTQLAYGAFDPLPNEATLEELQQMQRRQNSTDLAVTTTVDAHEIEIGAHLTYRITVMNLGPNPAGRVEVVGTLSRGVTYESDSGGCVAGDSGVGRHRFSCELGALLAGELREFSVRVSTAHVDRKLGHTTSRIHVRVDNVMELAGPDPNPRNNVSTTTTRLISREADRGRNDKEGGHGGPSR
jgi:uncharacterized repeat protein (TIGR01451 family)